MTWSGGEVIADEEHIMAYLSHLYRKGHSTSTVNTAINAIKYWLEQVEGNGRKSYYIKRPKKEKSLPKVLNLKEIKRIFDEVKNLKHITLLKTLYACGLRVGEVLRLEVSDVDGQRRLLHIRCSKQYKDRYVPLSEDLLHLLRRYYKRYKPEHYLYLKGPPGMLMVSGNPTQQVVSERYYKERRYKRDLEERSGRMI
jgi:site-specific recombinase XerD